MSLASEFKEFAMKGSVIDLAVGVVVGAAFGKIVSSLVGDVIMPPIGMAVGGVKGEGNILIDAVALRSIFIGAPDHAALQSVGSFLLHNGNAALRTIRPSTIAVQRSAGFRFIKSAVRIIRKHGMYCHTLYLMVFHQMNAQISSPCNQGFQTAPADMAEDLSIAANTV